MREILDIQEQLIPDLTDVLKKRYTILQHMMMNGTVGRRTLAAALQMTERVLRAEVDFLKAQGFVETESSGMSITPAGMTLLERMGPIVQELFGLTDLEERIRTAFGLQQVIIVPGDSDSSDFAKKQLGRAGSNVLASISSKDHVIAVTGGSTMAEVANQLTKSTRFKDTWFVPARGALGESLDFQANTVASMMAKKTGAKYRLLHVPDVLSGETYQTLIQEPNIQEIIQTIRQSRIVIHGIGDAMVMAKRRKVDEQTILTLREEGALAEAFGYYFDREGKVVHNMPIVGLRIEDIQNMEVTVAIAGGKSKGEAIACVLRFGHEDILVTDEAAALELVKHI